MFDTWRNIRQWAETYKEFFEPKKPQEVLGAEWAKELLEKGLSESWIRKQIDGCTDPFDLGARNHLNNLNELKEKEND